jgi:hypothetical protein
MIGWPGLAGVHYFVYRRNTEFEKDDAATIARFADMLTAMGTEPRLRIVRLLLSAHPAGPGRGGHRG